VQRPSRDRQHPLRARERPRQRDRRQPHAEARHETGECLCRACGLVLVHCVASHGQQRQLELPLLCVGQGRVSVSVVQRAGDA
jgi:hypothetical protein